MQSKTVFVAILFLLCAGIIGFTLLDASGPASPSDWSTGDEESLGEQAIQSEISGRATEEPESPTEPSRSSVATDAGAVAGASRVVRGRVVDKNRAPVEGAQVLLTAGERLRGGRSRQRVEKEAVTAGDGTFAFAGLSFDRIWVSVEVRHADFAVSTVTKSYDDDGERDVGDVALVVGGAIEGRVVDAGGAPIANATLALSAEGFDWRRMMGMRRGAPETTTDASGVFRIEKIAPGSYRIRARAPGHQRNTTEAITVVDTQQVQLDPIELGPGFALAGVVFGSNGAPIKKALVEIRGETRERGKRTNAKGEFRFDHLAAGKYDIEVEAEGYLRNVDGKGIAVPAGSGSLTISMRSGLSIEGAVTDATTGMPVPRFAARVRRLGDLPDPAAEQDRARRDKAMAEMGQLWRLGDKRTAAQQKKLDELTASMRDARGRRGTGRRGTGRRGTGGRGWGGSRRDPKLPEDPGDVEARADGRFRFEGLEEGIYVVDIGSPDHQRVRTAKLEVRQGSTVAPLSVVVRSGLMVDGKVSSSGRSPVSDARVELRLVLDESSDAVDGVSSATWVSSGPKTTRVMETRSEPDGSFSLAHAPAGRYLLRVSADEFATYSTEPFDLARDRSGIALEVGGLGVIEGRVSGLAADSASTAKVLVHMGPRTWRDVSIAEDGSYRIADLEPGDYLVRTYAREGARQAVIREIYTAARDPEGAKVDVQVEEGGVHRFDLTMPEEVAGEVVGRVFVNGEAAAGYRVSLRKAGEESGGRRRGFFGRQRGPRATVDAKGDYRIEQVQPGKYTLSVSSNQRRRDGDVARARVSVSARETVIVPQIAVDFGSLSGFVVDPSETRETQEKQPISGRVVLYEGVTEVPDSSSSADVMRYSAAVRDGAFSFSEIPTGSYLLVLRVSGCESVTQSVMLSAGGQAEVRLNVGKKRAGKDSAEAAAFRR